MSYGALWCKSNFSFLEGASHPEELVEKAHRMGLKAIAITDRDGLYGVARAHVRAQELGMHLIIGSTITTDTGDHLVLLVQGHTGYRNLSRLITKGRRRCPKGESRVRFDEIAEHADDLICMWLGEGDLGRLKAPFGERLYTMVGRHHTAEEADSEPLLRSQSKLHQVPVVGAVEVLYHHPSRRPLHDVVTCVRHGVTLTTAGRLTKSNDEHHLKSSKAFERLFVDDHLAVAHTREIAERCNFDLSQIRHRYPSERLPDGRTSMDHLRHLSYEGARWRYQKGVPPEVMAQIDRELGIIDQLDYPGYFLTMYEIVQFCQREGILAQGRGSAANSAVCYCLGVTAVDPTRVELLFERFLSPERAEPPDIDLDIMHDRREEVIQYVYEKYGRSRAAMVANVIRYRWKSAVRDVGKALGLPETAMDKLSKQLSRFDGSIETVLKAAGLDPRASGYQHLMGLASEILDAPRHLGIHPGGFMLGHEPVHDLVPIENATMEGRTVIQWDKYDVEALGLFKVDLLGLGALTLLDNCFDLLREHKDVDECMATLPADDPETYDMICKGDTVGTFQIESRAQMAMLPRLKPRKYYDLVIEVSIVRPGPITGGMVHPYLRRRNGEEEVTYPHPCLEPVLKKTLGVPLFQEQVMKLAVVAADYTAGEADQLRRDMGAWRSSGRIEGHRDRLITRMTKKGIAQEFAERVFEQIRGFGEYGFPESHAASFALISYATSWLKCHHPETFTCGLLNAWPMGFYSPATLVEDAKRHGVIVLPICALQSQWYCTLERGPRGSGGRPPDRGGQLGLRMGLRFVKGLNEKEGLRITRAASDIPKSEKPNFEVFARLARLSIKALRALGECGAFEGFGLDRRGALWTIEGLDNLPMHLPVRDEQPNMRPLAPLQLITWDYRASSHSPRGHPLEPLRELPWSHGLPDARTVSQQPDGRRLKYAGIAICRQRPGTASGVTFMTLEDETGFVNVVVWKRVFELYASLVRSESFVGLTGRIQSAHGVVHLVAEQFWIPPFLDRPPPTPSRDFH